MKKIILNNKCYFKINDIEPYKKELLKISSKSKYDFILFPPLLYLNMFNDSKIITGTQNFHSYNMGSFTGEISLEQLKELNVKYTIVGHYERRKLIGECYYISKEKLFKSLNSKFNTILCVGEIKKSKRPFSYIKKELNYYLKEIDCNYIKYLSIAYEPNWAVGSGFVQCIDKINNTILKIKKYIKEKYDFDIEVYYGGSITEDNIKDILDITDGIVLGKVSTNISELNRLLLKI